MDRRDLLKYGGGGILGIGIVNGIISGGDGVADNDDTPTGTATETAEPTATPTPKERVEQAARDGLNAEDDYVNDVFELKFDDGYNDGNGPGTSLDIRYMLHVDGFGSLKDDAERRAGEVFVSVYEQISSVQDVGDVNSVFLFAYVDTKDGDRAVSTKIGTHIGEIQSIDYDSCPWQCVRDDHAEQYKFNEYLYD